MAKPNLPQIPNSRDVRVAFDQMGDIVMARVLSQRTVNTTSTKIAHGLGRVPMAYWPVNIGNIRPTKSADADETFIYYLATTAGRYDFVVF